MAWIEPTVLLASLALPLIAQQPATHYSIEKEQALGKMLAADVRKRVRQFNNPVVAEYVNRIGNRLVSHLGEQPFTYSFELVITADAVEPMSIPAGHIFIPATFLLATQDEPEFAFMLAHTMGHIALRQATRAAIRAQATNMGTIPLMFTGWISGHVDSKNQASLVPMGFQEHQRRHELEADAFGIDLAVRAGYDPSAFRRYVERTQPRDSTMSPLPQRELRLARIDEILGKLQPAPTVSPADIQRIQDLVRAALPKRTPPTLRR